MARYPTLFMPGNLMSAGGNDPFLTLHREMNRLFDDMLRGGGVAAGGERGHQGATLLAPHMDATETDAELRIQAELPGVNEKDIEVSLNEDVLTIRADKHQDQEETRQGTHFSERSFGTYQRSLRLPFLINPDQVQARFANGVLSITLPKTAQQERSRRIPVQVSPQGGTSQLPGGQGIGGAEPQGSTGTVPGGPG